MSSATTIHLVRHATYDLLDQGILAGRSSGWGLNEAGQAQAAALGGFFAARKPAAIVASPLERAQQTAFCIAAKCNLDVQSAPDLDEIDFGEWTGMSFADLHQHPGWQLYNARRSINTPPRGESMLAVQLRALRAVTRLTQQFPDSEVVAVTHADVIKALIAYALGMPLDMFQRLEIAPASRSPVIIGARFIRVLGVNLPL